ncbi:hypothetical protein ACFLZH_01630 [Patescibacteria group bacterium]
MPQEKTCQISGKKFTITNEDIKYYKKLGVPLPTLCPEERMRRRFTHRNEKFLYKNKSAMSGEELITCYHPQCGLKVYSYDEWWGDKWDAIEYGREFDFGPKGKPFFEQFDELQKDVPVPELHVTRIENCPYVNYVGDSKNSYMIFGSIYAEDCMYGSPYYCKDTVDTFLSRDCELCYETITCEKCYSCAYCQNCANSNNLTFCFDCRNCSDCIGCVGLRSKKFHIFNKKYSQEEYNKLKSELSLCNPEQRKIIEDNFNALKKQMPQRWMISVNTENCEGNYIYESKNCHDCFDVKRSEDCSYSAQVIDMKDCYDNNYTEENELCYEYLGYYRNKNCVYSMTCYGSSDLKYSAYCMNCNDCFGCIGLRHKKYCIFNKQYTKKEYEELRDRIIEHMKKSGEWGEFFPASISPFGYNETVANEYAPMTKEEAVGRGYKWREADPKEFKKQEIVVPEDIKEVPDSIVNEILACSDCGKNYKIIAKELKFYQKLNIPIPKKCFVCRHMDRLALRNPRNLWERDCDRCHSGIKTSFDTKSPEKVYCESCYLNDVV